MKHVKSYENLKSLDVKQVGILSFHPLCYRMCASNLTSKGLLFHIFFVIQRCNLTMLMPTLQECCVLFFSVTPRVCCFSNGGKHFGKMCHLCGPKMGNLREKCAFVASLEGIFGFSYHKVDTVMYTHTHQRHSHGRFPQSMTYRLNHSS